MPVSLKTVSDPDLLRPSSNFGFFTGFESCMESFTGIKHLAELRFQLTPREARCRGQMVQLSIFLGGVKMFPLASIRSASFSIPVMEKADFCLEISLLQLIGCTNSTDFVLSFVSKPHWPPTIARKKQALLSIIITDSKIACPKKKDVNFARENTTTYYDN